MYLLDTDILIWILRGRQDIVNNISKLKDNSPIALSVITIAEIYMNIFPSELVNTEEHLNQYIILEVDQKIAKMAGLYHQQFPPKLAHGKDDIYSCQYLRYILHQYYQPPYNCIEM